SGNIKNIKIYRKKGEFIMSKVLYEKDINKEVLNGKKIAVIGYGSQGHAHALNLRDSGLDVVIGQRPRKSQQKAEEDGFNVYPVDEAVKQSDVVMVLLPDELQAKVYEDSIKENLKEGSALAFAHGFNIHYYQVQPPANVDVFLVASIGSSHVVSSTFDDRSGVP